MPASTALPNIVKYERLHCRYQHQELTSLETGPNSLMANTRRNRRFRTRGENT